METRVVTAHLPIELAKQIDLAAERMERPRGWIIKQAVTQWLALEERRYQLTLEAIGDIDAGNFVPHEKIMAWAESLGVKTGKREGGNKHVKTSD